jgi:hypothetical protein
VRIDKHQLPAEAGASQIPSDNRANRTGAIVRTNQGDRSGIEQPIEIANGHENILHQSPTAPLIEINTGSMLGDDCCAKRRAKS